MNPIEFINRDGLRLAFAILLPPAVALLAWALGRDALRRAVCRITDASLRRRLEPRDSRAEATERQAQIQAQPLLSSTKEGDDR